MHQNGTNPNSTTSDVSKNPDLGFYQMVYGVSVAVMLVLSIVKGYSFTKVTLHGSSKLHDTMFRRVRLSLPHAQSSQAIGLEMNAVVIIAISYKS